MHVSRGSGTPPFTKCEAPASPILIPSYIRPYAVIIHSNQILRGDKSRWEEIHYRVEHVAGPGKICVTNVDARSVCGIASVLVRFVNTSDAGASQISRSRDLVQCTCDILSRKLMNAWLAVSMYADEEHGPVAVRWSGSQNETRRVRLFRSGIHGRSRSHCKYSFCKSLQLDSAATSDSDSSAINLT